MTIIPAGFIDLALNTGFLKANGPFYWRAAPGGGFDYGFPSDERHGNMTGIVHGGIVFAFLDTIAGHTLRSGGASSCVTIQFDARFIGATPVGAWISGSVRVRKRTKQLAFVDTEALCGDALLATATGVFRIYA